MSLRIALFGTGSFALSPFRALIDSDHSIVAVYTQPDRTGRGHHRHVNPVKALAEQHSNPVRQPSRINEPDVLEELRAFAADIFVVAAYGQILKPEFLAIPRLGAFNLHGSLLPRHRGAAPVQYSIRMGDTEAGVTMFQIEPSLDSGPMVGKVATQIGIKETSGELMERLAELSGPLTLDVLQQLESGTAVFEPQDASQVTLAPRIKKEEGVIDWHQSAAEIDCHIRSMQPWPKASATLQADQSPLRCIINDADPLPDATSVSPGVVVEAGKQLLVAADSGMLRINRIQPQGKQAMDVAAFVNGYRITSGMRFGE